MRTLRASVLPLSVLLAAFGAYSIACTAEQDLGARDAGETHDASIATQEDGSMPEDDASTEQPDTGTTDKTAPTVKLSISPSTVTSAGDVKFTVTATDASGIAKVTIDQDGDNYATFTKAPYTGTLPVSSADNGVYTFTATATDAKGNVGTSTAVKLTINIPGTVVPDAGADAAVTPDAGGGDAGDGGTIVIAPAGSKRVFVTEGTYSGDLKTQGNGSSGPDGADKICNQEATVAGLGGTWKAWIRDINFGSGALRVGAHGPYARLVDNALVFPNALATGNPMVAINRTSAGTLIAQNALSYPVLSGLNNDGTSKSPGSDCQNWTSSSSGYDQAYGDCRDTHMHNWSSTGTHYCNNIGRLYCFEQ